MLQIRLFGKPQVICDGTDITPELGNKGCALLCILFLRGGDYYAREKLAAYLWPDSAVSAAKYNLRYTLWKIKKSTDTGEGGRSLIKLDREYCCIDRAYDYICDLQTIDEIDPETRSADELKRACDAFGGELLEGYYFNHCEDLNELILSQRIYYEKRKNRLLMKAAELYEQRDMLPEAVGILERVMEYEPYNEQLALRLMTLYERGGDRSRAIRFFNEFRNRLASNLEIYPGSGPRVALLDLGVSSYQLDNPERGFAYSVDAPLDMRMSREGMTAADILNTYDVDAMARIFREFGEERFAYPIAKRIAAQREKEPFTHTGQLVELIYATIPAAARREGGHPAKRVFQALRIAVNSELDQLSQCLDTAFDCLNPGGRFVILTFHSLEDRMVKQKFAGYCQGCTCPPEFPVCVCGKKPRAKLINRKPIEADAEELAQNSRSKSAKLRILEKL